MIRRAQEITPEFVVEPPVVRQQLLGALADVNGTVMWRADLERLLEVVQEALAP